MQRLKTYKLLALTLGTFVFLLARSAFPQTGLEDRIRKIIADSSLREDATAVAVVLVDSGKTLTAINADKPLNPASCTKIITAATALKMLGPAYQFETVFYSDKPPTENGRIHNLYVKGNGDPSWVTEELYRTAYDLAQRNVKTVTGDIVIDDSYFDGPWYPKKNGNNERAYTAFTSAVALNFNSVKLIIAPGRKVGVKAQVTTEPPTPYINIVNKVRTGGKYRIYIKQGTATPDSEIFIVSGSIPVRTGPRDFYRSLQNPLKYAGYSLKYVLGEYGVTVAGNVRPGRVPHQNFEILKQKSKPLGEIVRDMNKFSNNFIAEQLTKHVGAKKKGPPGSTAKGMEAFNAYLDTINVPSQSYAFENGSGLSINNRVSARQLAKILQSIYRETPLRYQFIDSLSILGVDGTMGHWRRSPELHGILRAKTGSLANVSALAGYVPTNGGKLAAFAILSNGFKKGRYAAQDAELMIVQAIAGTN